MKAAGPLQKAIYDALTDALDPVEVFDAVPEDETTYPRVNIGNDTHADWSSKTFNGEQHTVTIHIWSRKRGNKETQDIGAAIYDALHEQRLSLDGHFMVLMRYEFSEIMLDPDGLTRHGVMRFRALTHES